MDVGMISHVFLIVYLQSALHDVDETVYYDHICNCPDRVLIDDRLVVRETGLVENTVGDVKGDMTVPEYGNFFGPARNPDPDVSSAQLV